MVALVALGRCYAEKTGITTETLSNKRMILSLATIKMLFILLHITWTFSRLSWRADFER